VLDHNPLSAVILPPCRFHDPSTGACPVTGIDVDVFGAKAFGTVVSAGPRSRGDRSATDLACEPIVVVGKTHGFLSIAQRDWAVAGGPRVPGNSPAPDATASISSETFRSLSQILSRT
jgi:hypothetical protein